MIDGLSTENINAGTVTASTTLSGGALAVASSEIGATEIAANAVTLTKISAAAVDGDTQTLSSGSRWVVFRSAFAAPPYVTCSMDFDTRTATGATATRWLAWGSIAAGSFLALGSSLNNGATFNWLAIGSR